MAGLTLKNVYRRFGSITAVEDVCLDIVDREFLVFVGPSGCGKSTTLRMIAGLEEISDGDIFIGDRCVNDLAPKDRNVAMVFQSYALYPHKNVYENIAFGLRARKTPRAQRDRLVREASEILGLGELLARKPRQLSGGQRQRVALGRAIVRSPSVFLFDEPLSNLDAKLRVQMRGELKRLHHTLGTTMIYVTHDQVEAMTMGDRIAIMNRGRIQQVGTPLEVYRHPRNVFVAGFIGSPAMNMFPCIAEERGGSMYLKADGIEIALEGTHRAKVENSGTAEFVLGVRPEDLTVSTEESTNAPAFTIEGRADLVDQLGKEMYVNVKVGRSMLTVIAPPDADIAEGDDLRVVGSPDKLHLFRRDDEEAISAST